MKSNNYNIEKIIDSLYNKGYTNFIVPTDLKLIKGKLNKNEYKIYEPYKDCTKVILYKKNIPEIKLFRIDSKVELRHQDILGTIFSLGLKEDTFGDIVKYQDSFYIFLLPHLVDYFKYNLTDIKNNKIDLIEEDILLTEKFKQEYISKQFIVTSLRIDNVISTITNNSRNQILDKFINKEILLNYEEDIKPTRTLKENDIFSIRKYGKYKFSKVVKTTKKGGFIIEVLIYK
ncbi:MAG: YlmH/Sll1252 family protein [Candidatus Coprovivens sp.]